MNWATNVKNTNKWRICDVTVIQEDFWLQLFNAPQQLNISLNCQADFQTYSELGPNLLQLQLTLQSFSNRTFCLWCRCSLPQHGVRWVYCFQKWTMIVEQCFQALGQALGHAFWADYRYRSMATWLWKSWDGFLIFREQTSSAESVPSVCWNTLTYQLVQSSPNICAFSFFRT